MKKFSVKNLENLIINKEIYNNNYKKLKYETISLKNVQPYNDQDYHSNSIEVQSTLVDCEMYVNWLNNIKLKNEMGGTYLFYNHIHRLNDIYYDIETNLYKVKRGKESHPVRGVNWLGALLFAVSYGGRLLTEKEWEYCASSNYKYTKYSWGDEEPNKTITNYGNNYGDTTPTKKFIANELGFYDMAGNVREWCLDCYHPHKQGDLNSLRTEYRVVKGGAWDKTSEHLKIFNRAGKWHRMGTMGIGFRVMWEMI